MRPILLLTRPRAQAERFAVICRTRLGRGYDTIISPILRIETLPLTGNVPLDTILIFSSENAVHAAADGGMAAGQTAYCVGDRTAEAAEAAGFRAISAHGNAESLIELITKHAPPSPLLYLHGTSVRTDVAASLREKGFQAEAQAVYTQVAQDISIDAKHALKRDAPVLLPLFSPRSAKLLTAATHDATAPLHIAALSTQVAAAWTGKTTCFRTASHPDANHMLDTLAILLRDTLP